MDEKSISAERCNALAAEMQRYFGRDATVLRESCHGRCLEPKNECYNNQWLVVKMGEM
jgi:hypothetical protein